jgi:hypothetical protein
MVAGAITHAPATPYQRIALRSVKGAAHARLRLPLTLATRFPDKGPLGNLMMSQEDLCKPP